MPFSRTPVACASDLSLSVPPTLASVVVSESQSPPPLSPIAGPSWAGSPTRAGVLPINRPGSPIGAGGFRVSPASTFVWFSLKGSPSIGSLPVPPTLDSVIVGRPVSPPQLSRSPGPSGSPPQSGHLPGPSGPSSAPAPQEPVAGGPSRPPRYRRPRQPSSPPAPESTVAGPRRLPWYREPKKSLLAILRKMRPRPGEPGSPQNPGTVQPTQSQRWLAAAFYGGLIPVERLKVRNEQCSARSICEEGTCCLDFGRHRKRCKPLSTHRQPCSPSVLTTVYYGACPCGPLEGLTGQTRFLFREAHAVVTTFDELAGNNAAFRNVSAGVVMFEIGIGMPKS
ncbi:hypothetical protein MRX96_018717 [Rhipicephalus microplus]